MVGDFLLPIPLTWTTKNFKIVKSRLRKLNPFGSVSSFELTILGTVTVLQCSKYRTFQIFLIQPNYTMKHPCVDLWVNRWIFFKDIWMIYSDFEWIKILLDMCFVIDDPIVCQIASYYKWNYNRIHSILHNFRYYLRKCDHNNVSFQSFQESWFLTRIGRRTEALPGTYFGISLYSTYKVKTPTDKKFKVEQFFKWWYKKSQNLEQWKQWRKSFKIQSHYYVFLDPNYKITA